MYTDVSFFSTHLFNFMFDEGYTCTEFTPNRTEAGRQESISATSILAVIVLVLNSYSD